MASVFKTLLQNIQTNCEDTTTYTSLPSMTAHIMASFALLPRSTYYAVIVAENSPAEGNLVTQVNQEVTVYLCHRLKKTPKGEYAVEDMLDKRLELREALNRPDPYGNGKPSASYTAMTGCKSVEVTGMPSPTVETEYYNGEEGAPTLVAPIELEYTMYVDRK